MPRSPGSKVGNAFNASIETRRLGRKYWLLWPKSVSSFSIKPFQLILGPVYLTPNLFFLSSIEFSFGNMQIMSPLRFLFETLYLSQPYVSLMFRIIGSHVPAFRG